MPGTNTPAYYEKSYFTVVKSFVRLSTCSLFLFEHATKLVEVNSASLVLMADVIKLFSPPMSPNFYPSLIFTTMLHIRIILKGLPSTKAV